MLELKHRMVTSGMLEPQSLAEAILRYHDDYSHINSCVVDLQG